MVLRRVTMALTPAPMSGNAMRPAAASEFSHGIDTVSTDSGRGYGAPRKIG